MAAGGEDKRVRVLSYPDLKIVTELGTVSRFGSSLVPPTTPANTPTSGKHGDCLVSVSFNYAGKHTKTARD